MRSSCNDRYIRNFTQSLRKFEGRCIIWSVDMDANQCWSEGFQNPVQYLSGVTSSLGLHLSSDVLIKNLHIGATLLKGCRQAGYSEKQAVVKASIARKCQKHPWSDHGSTL